MSLQSSIERLGQERAYLGDNTTSSMAEFFLFEKA
jgi:hypothetical protein